MHYLFETSNEIYCFCRKVFGNMADCLILIASLTLWSTVYQFGKVYTQNKLSWNIIRAKYDSVKEIASFINSIHGTSFSVFLVVSVLEYAICLDEVFVEGTLSHGGNMITIFYFLEKCVIIVVAADICRQVKKQFILPSLESRC